MRIDIAIVDTVPRGVDTPPIWKPPAASWPLAKS